MSDKTELQVQRKPYIDYVVKVRKLLPEGFELAVYNKGLSPSTQAYVLSCFLNKTDPKVCADNLREGFPIVEDAENEDTEEDT